MHKFPLTLLVTIFSTFNLYRSSVALAVTPGIDSLKERAIASFLRKANNLRTPLHTKLVELNLIDGRNANGIFPKILTKKDIKIVEIDGQDQFGSYCSSIQGKSKYYKCSRGVSENYLILIPSKTGVHKATEYQQFLFVVKASKNIEWKKNENDKESDRKESIEIGDPILVPLEKLVPENISK